MKTLVLAASAALLLAAPGLSLAQDDHHHDGGHPGGGPDSHAPRPAGPPAAERPGAAPGGAFHPQGFATGQPARGDRPQGFVGAPQPNINGGRPGPQFSGQVAGGYRAAAPGGRGAYYAQGGDRGGGRPGAQPFGYGGRQYFRYRAAPYRFPGGYYGWADHAWRRGEWLPPVFITSGYFINDWYDFGLWQPDYGYQWIRVGADAVLVDLADGQVVDVVPGIYYY